MSIKQVADAIVKAVGFEGEYAFDASKADGQFRKPASNRKLLGLIGEFQFTPFEQGAYVRLANVEADADRSGVQRWTSPFSGFCRTTRRRGRARLRESSVGYRRIL